MLRCILCFYASRRYRKLLCYYMAVNRAVPIELFYHYCSIRTHVPSQNKIHLYTHTFKNELGYFHGQTCLDFEKEKKWISTNKPPEKPPFPKTLYTYNLILTVTLTVTIFQTLTLTLSYNLNWRWPGVSSGGGYFLLTLVVTNYEAICAAK